MERTLPLGGRTLLAAIFGDPVAQSLSPAMHNAAYAELGMERAYAAFHVTPAMLHAAIRAIPALGIIGVNLTVPHKEDAVPMMAALSAEARTLGAINCVVNRKGMLYGDNTDARGLEADLRALCVEIRRKTAIIIGAGGAASSALLTCIRMGAGRIVVSNRTPARAVRLVRRFSALAAGRSGRSPLHKLEARGLDVLIDPMLLGETMLIINATPMGLKTGGFTPLAYAATSSDCVFYDMVYGKEATPFIRPALESGRRAVDGAGMLANQGELAFKLFNRVPPPAGVMRRVLMKQLGRPIV